MCVRVPVSGPGARALLADEHAGDGCNVARAIPLYMPGCLLVLGAPGMRKRLCKRASQGRSHQRVLTCKRCDEDIKDKAVNKVINGLGNDNLDHRPPRAAAPLVQGDTEGRYVRVWVPAPLAQPHAAARMAWHGTACVGLGWAALGWVWVLVPAPLAHAHAAARTNAKANAHMCSRTRGCLAEPILRAPCFGPQC